MMSLDNNIKAIFLIILGMFVFSIQDTLIKLMSDSINIYVIYIIRSIVGISVIFTYCWIYKIPLIFKTHYPFITIFRVFIFFLGFSLYYFSLSKISNWFFLKKEDASLNNSKFIFISSYNLFPQVLKLIFHRQILLFYH